MENDNFLLKRKIKSDPLTKAWVDYFFANHVSRISLESGPKDRYGSIEVVGRVEDTPRLMALLYSDEFTPLKFHIRIFPENVPSWKDLELQMGHTLMHECAHPKYHLWTYLDEISTGECGPWHRLIDEEACRFANENVDYVSNLIRRLRENP